MNSLFILCPSRNSIALITASLLLPFLQLHAQESLSPGISSGLSDSISQSTQTGGFNGVFDPSSANLTGGNLHTDVNDATHSQLLGSALSPVDLFTVNSTPQTTSNHEVLTDAQQAVGASNPLFGGRANHTFTPGGSAGVEAAANSRRISAVNLGMQSMQAAFTGGISARAAFSGAITTNTAAASAFSGNGIAQPRTTSGVGLTQNLVSANDPDATSTYDATDPVLSNSTSGYLADLQINGDLPSPSSVVATEYATGPAPEPSYQYDDGQTPRSGVQSTPGTIIGVAPEYNIPIGGFPDSTKGLAGLPSEASLSASPFQPLRSAATSPFAPVSEGNVYRVQAGLHPDLYRIVPATPSGSLARYERRAQQARMHAGLSISQSSSLREQDRRNYQRRAEYHHRSPRVTLENTATGQTLFTQSPIR